MRQNRLFDEFSNIFRSFDNLFLSALEDAGVAPRWRGSRTLLPAGTPEAPTTSLLPARGAWTWDRAYPAVECFTQDQDLVFRAELPGVSPDDVEVQVVGNQLVLRGRKEEQREQKEEGFQFSEVYHGRFERAFTLPEGANADKIQATHRDGVLEIRMPAEGLVPASRRIPIQVEGGGKKKAA
jgi:HSP20 family protein